MTSNTLLRAVRTIAVLSALAGVIVALHLLERTGLRGPSGFSRAELTVWLDDPIAVVATVFRWVGLVLSYYLVAIVVAVAAFGDNFDTSPVRRVVPKQMSGLVGILLGVSAVAIPLSIHVVHTDTARTTAPTEQLRLSVLDDPLTLTPTRITPERSRVDEYSPERRRASTAQTPPETWTVAQGESFWSIAEEHLADAWGRADLTDKEIAGYWRTLIDANVDRLVEPGNPDLLLPDQQLFLPRTPPARG